MRKQDPPIEETLRLLSELVRNQDKTLETANDIITMKNRMIELCELEIELYKRHMNKVHMISIGLSILVAIESMILIFL